MLNTISKSINKIHLARPMLLEQLIKPTKKITISVTQMIAPFIMFLVINILHHVYLKAGFYGTFS